MSKRQQDDQGGGERYGFTNGPGDMTDRPQHANAAQMARRKIAQVKKAGASGRSSRANTPTGNPFAPQQQSMASFQLPGQGGGGGGGDGSGFNFSVNAPSNPFQNTNGASGTPPPSFGMNQQPQQQNGAGGMFGNNNTTSFGSTFASNASTPQPNGFGFGQNNNANGSNTGLSFGQNNTQNQTQQNGATQGSGNQFSFGSTNGAGKPPFQFGGQTQQQTPTTQDTSFSSFGQNAQPNGDKPAASFTGFGQSTQQQNADKPATPSFNLGQTAQQNSDKPATPSTGLFGQSNTTQPQTNGEKTSMFSAASQTEQTPKPGGGSLFTFNSSNQGIGHKSETDSAAKPAEASKAPIGNLFGAQQNNGSGLFGSTPPPRESSASPKPGDSIFSTQNKPKLGGNLFTSNMAEGKKPDAPAPSFGQQPQQNGSVAADAEQTPKATNIFSGFGQSQANAVQDTPKPSSNLFSASSFGQTPSQPATAPKNLFGQSTQDISMNTPGSTPQKTIFAPVASQQAAPPAEQPPASETPAPGRSLFDRISRPEHTAETPASDEAAALPRSTSPEKSAVQPTAQKALFNPSTNLFNTPAQQPAPSASLFGAQTAPSTMPKAPSLSSQASTSQSAANSQPAQSSSMQKKASSTLADVIPQNEKETLKVLNEGLMTHLATQDPNADWTTVMEYYLKQAAIIRHKPAPELKTLSAAPSSSSTASAQSAERAAAPSSVSAPEQPAPLKKPTPFVRPQPAPSSGSTSNNIFSSSTAATPKAPTPFQRTASSDSQQTPKPSFLQAPATAPVNRKRSAEDEAERPPASEKRARPAESTAYPKLPENASDVSKAFYNALENKSTDASLFSPKTSAPSSDLQPAAASKQTEKEAHKGPLPATAQLQPFSSGGFKPSGSGFTPSTSGFNPSSSGFTPSGPSSGSNNFFAAFGKKASEQQDKDRKKRKDEDYDSDEETEEQWAERDRKEQEAKRAKVLADSRSASGFMLKATPSKSPEKKSAHDAGKGPGVSQDGTNTDSGDKHKPAESGQGKSLFNRISKPATTGSESPSLFASQTPASKTPTSNIFGSSAGASNSGIGSSLFGHLAKSMSNETPKAPENAEKGETVEKQTQGTGDNTWNQNTPIKFGSATSAENGSTTPAAPPPAFGNLFGPKAQSSATSGMLNVPSAKPAIGFNFGAQPSSVNGSRATTPGVTTDGEGTGTSTAGDADNEPSDNPPEEAQVEDMTGLSAQETKGETLLYSVAMSKASKWDEKKDDEGGMTHGWVDKGKGPLYLLKNDDTGKVRILLKVPPYGAAKMNFPPLKGGGYEVQGKAGKQITGTFYDHMADKPGLGKWLIAVGKKEDAEEVGRVLKENMPK